MKKLRQIVWNKFNCHCAYCGEHLEYKNMQVDHIIPKRNFLVHIHNKFKVPKFLKHLRINDIDHIDNLHPACRKCNLFKKDFELEFFRSELSEQVKRANKTSSNYRTAKRFGQIEETIKPIIFYFETNEFKL